ncbi:MAG TPA: glycine--tRNA ligase subunit beta [Rhizomicrobium sp.]|nr:glycine--tRNA ligase subunit beta [Rhizomicrobium sp.]
MAGLLLELFSEEIPARMQVQAARDLEKLVVGALSDRGLLLEGVKVFSGPRRLTLAMSGLPARQPDVKEELKGPKTDAPAAALDGFLRKTGLTKDQLKVEKTPKGDVYLAVIDRKGRDTIEVLAEILPECFAKLPWPKSMRFPSSPVRWVRPLHGIVCMFDAEVVPFEFAGVKSGNTTVGHRFLSDGKPIRVRHFEDYEKALHDAHVVLDAEQRKAIIFEELKAAAFVRGLELIPDEGLLDEVAGLAEWPVVLVGAIQDEFMDVPPEILQTSMRTHQKYFSLRDPQTGKMANRFAVISNMVAQDGGKEIIAGNERVLRARLSDAKFFWDQDRKRSLESRVNDLKTIVFHAKAGTVYGRACRIAILSMIYAELLGFDVKKSERAGLLAKADLLSGVVGEFPELQGIMGGYYARADNEDDAVADAVRDHYKPVGASDAVPTAPISVATALAEKTDNLISLWRAGEVPTGSKDPFALRRSALGLIRTLMENKLRVPLLLPAFATLGAYIQPSGASWEERLEDSPFDGNILKGIADDLLAFARDAKKGGTKISGADRQIVSDVMAFLADRLKVALREKGTRHDLIDAVFSLGGEDDLVRLAARVEALQNFLKSDDGANLLVAYKRAANILKAEEKKDNRSFDGDSDPQAFVLPEEKSLYVELAAASEMIRAEVERERFVEAMGVMARLRKPVDAFFDKVTVNDKDAKLRENRLKLLSRLRATLHLVADFSKIEG